MISLIGMISLAYNRSPRIKEALESIDRIRQTILLYPLSPKTLLRLRWEATINHLFFASTLFDRPIKKSDLITLLTSKSKRTTSTEQEILAYRIALVAISQEWLGSKKTVVLKTLLDLYELTCQPGIGKSIRSLLRLNEEPLKRMLSYIQSGNEHPVIQAGIAYAHVVILAPFAGDSLRIATLLSHLFLTKYGYDIRGLWSPIEYWVKQTSVMEEILQATSHGASLTPWLEFFTGGVVSQLEKVESEITSGRFASDIPGTFAQLTDRQQQILRLGEEPSKRITNRDVQKTFGISQITASRDLSKLATLGLLFPHGKGRSVYYTRA